MRPALLAVLLCAAAGASAAIVAGKTWSFYDDEKQLTKVILKVNSKEGISLLTTNTNRFDSVSLSREEAASLGRALLEAAGEKPTEPSCDFLKGYIEMRNRMIADPETSDFLRGIYSKEVAWARTKIQTIVLDKGCQ